MVSKAKNARRRVFGILKVRDNVWQRDAGMVRVVWANLGWEGRAQTQVASGGNPVHWNCLVSLHTVFRGWNTLLFQCCLHWVHITRPVSMLSYAQGRSGLSFVLHASARFHPRPPSSSETLLHSSLQHSIGGVKLQILRGLFYSWESWITERLSGLLKVRNW